MLRQYFSVSPWPSYSASASRTLPFVFELSQQFWVHLSWPSPMPACFLTHRDFSGLRRLSFKTGHLSSVPVPQKAASEGFCLPELWASWSFFSWILGLFSLLHPFSLPLRSSAWPSHSCWRQVCLWLLNLDSPSVFVSCATKSIFPSWPIQNLCQTSLGQEICWIACVLPYHHPGKVLGW